MDELNYIDKLEIEEVEYELHDIRFPDERFIISDDEMFEFLHDCELTDPIVDTNNVVFMIDNNSIIST